MDADGEADADGEPDDRLYCICQQKSYGEMIGCDNDECPYEWVRLFLDSPAIASSRVHGLTHCGCGGTAVMEWIFQDGISSS
jgi:hypothetical protein